MDHDRNRSAGALAAEIARLYGATLQAALQPLGLSRAQYLALNALWHADGLTQREMAERLGVEQATMANTLARMERDGLIERRPNPDDGRSQQIWLTDDADRLRAPATEVAIRADELVVSGLPAAERELFLSMMARVAANLRSVRTS